MNGNRGGSNIKKQNENAGFIIKGSHIESVKGVKLYPK